MVTMDQMTSFLVPLWRYGHPQTSDDMLHPHRNAAVPLRDHEVDMPTPAVLPAALLTALLAAPMGAGGWRATARPPLPRR